MSLEAGGVAALATVGFGPVADPAGDTVRTWAPRELFLDPRETPVGSPVAALLADASTAISVALQHGVPAAAMAHSLARVGSIESPGDVTDAPGSIIGAALDSIVAELAALQPADADEGDERITDPAGWLVDELRGSAIDLLVADCDSDIRAVAGRLTVAAVQSRLVGLDQEATRCDRFTETLLGLLDNETLTEPARNGIRVDIDDFADLTELRAAP